MTDRLPVIVAVENEPVARKEIEVQLRRHSSDYVVALARIYARQRSFVADDQAGFTFKFRDRKVVWAKVYASEDEALAGAGWA